MLRLAVTPAELDVAVGEPVVLQLEVYNSRPVIDGFRASLLGLPDLPFTSEPSTLSLFPDSTGVILLTFAVPADIPAGPRVIGVKVASVTEPSESAAEEIRLNVAPLAAATFTVEPLTQTVGKRAELSLIVANQGNVALEPALRGVDSDGTLTISLEPSVLRLGPGEKAASTVVVTGRRPLLGSPVPHQLTFTADGLPQATQATAMLLQKPLLPRAVLTLLSIVLAVAMWAVVLLVAVDKVADKVKEDPAAELQTGPFADLPGGGGVLASVAGKVTASPNAKGATVSLIPLPATNGGTAPAAPEPITTPESGEYRFEQVVAPAVYQIVFAKVGLGTQSRLIELKLGQQLTGEDVTLVGGSAAMVGTVADPKGPVGAATVTATNGRDTISTVTSPSGPVGSYALDSLPAPGTYVVAVTKEGYGTQTSVIDLARGQRLTAPSVVISQGRGSISGTVLSRAGLPVGGVAVTVRAGPGAVPTTVIAPVAVRRTQGPDVLGTSTTLAEGPIGFFSVSGLPTPGTFTVTFEKAGFVLNTATVALADNGNETNLSPILQPVTGVITGTVAQVVRRVEPCPPAACRIGEVQVRIIDRNGSEVRNTTTASSPADRIGRYEVAGLPAGPYTVTFSKLGYVSQTFSVTLVDTRPELPLDVILRGSPATITGTAANCLSVDLVLRDGTAFDPPVSATVRDGTYRLPRVETPGEYLLVFQGVESADPLPLDLDAGETGVEINGACPPPTQTSGRK